jgi:hypothetical protein
VAKRYVNGATTQEARAKIDCPNSTGRSCATRSVITRPGSLPRKVIGVEFRRCHPFVGAGKPWPTGRDAMLVKVPTLLQPVAQIDFFAASVRAFSKARPLSDAD